MSNVGTKELEIINDTLFNHYIELERDLERIDTKREAGKINKKIKRVKWLIDLFGNPYGTE